MSAVIKIERCDYCSGFIENENILQCKFCQGNVHIKCLPNSSTPGDFIGDIFFDLTCINCAKQQKTHNEQVLNASVKEVLVRQHLSWVMVIVLVLYNLGIKSKGLSHHGYFHWQNHIANFIEKNWRYLFETAPRRRKRWIGTIAGVLSHHSPDFFISGLSEIKQSGWWKLTHANRTPKYIFMLYEQFCQKRQQQRLKKRLPIEAFPGLVEPKKLRNSADCEDDAFLMGTCSRAIPYMGRKPKVANQLNIEEDSRTATQSNLMDFLAETFSNDNLTVLNNLTSGETLANDKDKKTEFLPFLDPNEENAHFENVFPTIEKNNVTTNISNCRVKDSHPNSSSDITECNKETIKSELIENDDSDDEEYKPRIVQVTNFQESKTIRPLLASNTKVIKKEVLSQFDNFSSMLPSIDKNTSDSENEPSTPLPLCKPSLFIKRTKRLWPWLMQTINDDNLGNDDIVQQYENSCLLPISTYEEKELLAKLKKILSLETKCKLTIPSHIRRFYRKLCVREWKREHGKPLFDLDTYQQHYFKAAQQVQNEAKILDRYQLISLSLSDTKKSFFARIAGSQQHEFFQSPYTQRILHPFIYRNKICFPPWLKLMCEIQYAKIGIPPTRATIDYCYVQLNHIAAVNALLQTLFWPGIDMSECLSYPDYSVVALYKQLVVGCGFLVPDVGFNEAYISFMAVRPGWQRSGIGTFMLYHLTQTCLTKDITLHVSATNPAVMLYQKFGFKVEEIILNFYDKYLPLDSKHSRHALFLRLSR